MRFWSVSAYLSELQVTKMQADLEAKKAKISEKINEKLKDAKVCLACFVNIVRVRSHLFWCLPSHAISGKGCWRSTEEAALT